jgi:hypothetical protein
LPHAGLQQQWDGLGIPEFRADPARGVAGIAKQSLLLLADVGMGNLPAAFDYVDDRPTALASATTSK